MKFFKLILFLIFPFYTYSQGVLPIKGVTKQALSYDNDEFKSYWESLNYINPGTGILRDPYVGRFSNLTEDWNNDGMPDVLAMVGCDPEKDPATIISLFESTLVDGSIKYIENINYRTEIQGDQGFIKHHIADFTGDGRLDVFYSTENYHGEDGKQPSFYDMNSNNGNCRYHTNDFFLINNGSGFDRIFLDEVDGCPVSSTGIEGGGFPLDIDQDGKFEWVIGSNHNFWSGPEKELSNNNLLKVLSVNDDLNGYNISYHLDLGISQDSLFNQNFFLSSSKSTGKIINDILYLVLETEMYIDPYQDVKGLITTRDEYCSKPTSKCYPFQKIRVLGVDYKKGLNKENIIYNTVLDYEFDSLSVIDDFNGFYIEDIDGDNEVEVITQSRSTGAINCHATGDINCGGGLLIYDSDGSNITSSFIKDDVSFKKNLSSDEVIKYSDLKKMYAKIYVKDIDNNGFVDIIPDNGFHFESSGNDIYGEWEDLNYKFIILMNDGEKFNPTLIEFGDSLKNGAGLYNHHQGGGGHRSVLDVNNDNKYEIITHTPGPPNPGAIGNFDSKPGLDIVYLDFESYVDTDYDQDLVHDSIDNCPLTANADQLDTDGDGVGDVCDNCVSRSNLDQKDENSNGVGDVCDSDLDTDGDGINNKNDNSLFHYNPKQEDIDNDGIGDWSDNSTVLKSISEKFQSDTISFFENLNLSIQKKYNANRLIEKIEIINVSDYDNQITIDKEKYILYVTEGHELEFFKKNLYDFQIYVHNKALNKNEIIIDTIDLRLYVDKFIEEKLVDRQKTSIANNLIEYKLINSLEEESNNQEFFDNYGDIPSKWKGPDFETHAYFYDLNNDGYLDLIFGDYRVDIFGRFFNIHHVSVPVYMTHDGDFNFTSRYNDEKNNIQNKTIIHSPNIKVLSDLNGDGIDEIVDFGEDYHIAYPPHHPHINYINEWFNVNDLNFGIDYHYYGNKTRYYSISENGELVDEVNKIDISLTSSDDFITKWGDQNENYLRNMFASTVGDIDSDGDIDLISSGQNFMMGYSFDILKNDGKGNFILESQNFNQSYNTSEGHMLVIDLDGDNKNDLLFGGQKNGFQSEYSIFGLIKGDGNTLDFNNPIFIEQMHPSLGLRSIYYEDINGDDIKEIIAYFTNGFGCGDCGLGDNDIPNIIKIYELVDESEGYLKDISDQYFNESENYMNFYASSSFLQYLDLDGDGYKDLIPKFSLADPELGWNHPSNAFRGNWNNSKGFQYFKYNDNNKKYEIIDIGQFNGLHHYNNFDFADLNNDNSLEWIIFNDQHSERGLYIYQYFFDSDGDGFSDNLDNCPLTANTDQLDTDDDGTGDVCDTDDDGDGVEDSLDNCPLTANPDQADWNNNGVGDVCGDPKALSAENPIFVENIYPNPTDDKLTVSIRPGIKIKDLYFVDFNGKLLKPKSINRTQDNLDINVSNLNEGVYILEIVSDKEVDKVKVIIER